MNLLVEHIQRDLIIAALRNDDVGKFLARLHELLVHRLDRRQILRHDGLQRSAALVDVANDAADNAHIGVRIDENLDVAEVAQLLVLKDQDTLHDDDLGGLDPHRLIDPVMYRKIVDRSFDTLARRQTAYMLDHQIRIKRVRVVVIQLFSFLKRNVAMLLIIKIVAQHGDFIAEFLFDFLDQGAFAGACAACNPDDNDIFHNASPLSCCAAAICHRPTAVRDICMLI